jgi:formylglycine-generating enzyme required for sulfatase activity
MAKIRGTGRVIRGGSLSSVAHYCRSVMRYGGAPDNRIIDIGFRLARSVTLGS